MSRHIAILLNIALLPVAVYLAGQSRDPLFSAVLLLYPVFNLWSLFAAKKSKEYVLRSLCLRTMPRSIAMLLNIALLLFAFGMWRAIHVWHGETRLLVAALFLCPAFSLWAIFAAKKD